MVKWSDDGMVGWHMTIPMVWYTWLQMKRAKSKRPKDCPFVGKGGLKLQFALEHFGVDVHGLVCGDLGCNVGGFTDCLIQAGAAKVYAVDTSYGLLAWKLRTDPRVIVFERTNVLHWSPPEQMDFVVSDLGWTPQEKALPVIAGMLKPRGRALSLVKPQYEAPASGGLVRNVLPQERIPEIMEMVRSHVPKELQILGEARSPYLGHGGNAEVWLLVTRESVPSPLVPPTDGIPPEAWKGEGQGGGIP